MQVDPFNGLFCKYNLRKPKNIFTLTAGFGGYHIFERINLRQLSILGTEQKKSCEGSRIFLNSEESYLSLQSFPTER